MYKVIVTTKGAFNVTLVLSIVSFTALFWLKVIYAFRIFFLDLVKIYIYKTALQLFEEKKYNFRAIETHVLKYQFNIGLF
jgi:hypothetical protein